ncbi:ribosome-binding protein 1-like [Branchiostoma lanceolatum]|uniref:ribosome-binding protein 1-like n=1 Tax=Branchiostoma lanceolatum TaxID=7740 RepID=UPI0034528A01
MSCREDSPILGNRTEDSPILGNRTEDCPILGNRTENCPILGNRTEDSPTQANRTEDSPILGNRTEDSPILGNRTEDCPILGNRTENCPILGNRTEDCPILGNRTEDSPILGNTGVVPTLGIGLPNPAGTAYPLDTAAANIEVEKALKTTSRKRKRGGNNHYTPEVGAKIAKLCIDVGPLKAVKKMTQDLGRDVSESTARSIKKTFLKEVVRLGNNDIDNFANKKVAGP